MGNKMNLAAELKINLVTQKSEYTNMISDIEKSLKKLKLPPDFQKSFLERIEKAGKNSEKMLGFNFDNKSAKTGVKGLSDLSKIYEQIAQEMEKMGSGQLKQLKADWIQVTDEVKDYQKIVKQLGDEEIRQEKLLKKLQDDNKNDAIELQQRDALIKNAKPTTQKQKDKLTDDIIKYQGAKAKYDLNLAAELSLEQQLISTRDKKTTVTNELIIAEAKLLKAEKDYQREAAKSISPDLIDKVRNYKDLHYEGAKALGEFADKQKKVAGSSNYLASELAYVTSAAFAMQKVFQGVRFAINTVEQLDKSLTEIAEVSGMTRKEVWSLLPTFQALADKVGATQQQIADAARLYYQQGLSTEQTMAVVESTSIAASLAGIKFAEATDRMTSAIRGFNMEYVDSMRVTDVYSKLAATTAADFNELSYAMTKTASIAQTAGMSFENTTAFLAKMIETTREAPENIGTAMKSIVARMTELTQNPAKALEDGTDLNKVQSVLRSVGVEFVSLNGEIKPLDKTIMELGQKWDSLDRNTQAYIATTIAGNRQQSRFLALMSNFDRTLELSDQAMNSTGAAASMFTTHLTSVETASNKLAQAQQRLATNLLDSELLISYKYFLADIVNILGSIPPIFLAIATSGMLAFGIFAKKMIEKSHIIETMATKMMAPWVGFKQQAINAFNSVNAPAQDTWKHFKKIGNEVGDVKYNLQKLGRVGGLTLRSLKASLKEFFNPITIIIMGITALISLIAWLSQADERRIAKKKEQIDLATQYIDKLTQESTTLRRLAQSYDELNNKLSLTNEQQKELIGTSNELAALMPNMVESYDEYGNAILKDNALVQEELKKRLKINQQIAAEQNKERLVKSLSLMGGEDVYSDELENKEKQLKELKKQIKNMDSNHGRATTPGHEAAWSLEDLKAKVKNLEENIIDMKAGELKSTYVEYGNSMAQYIALGVEEASPEVIQALNGALIKYSASFLNNIETFYGKALTDMNEETITKTLSDLEYILQEMATMLASDSLDLQIEGDFVSISQQLGYLTGIIASNNKQAAIAMADVDKIIRQKILPDIAELFPDATEFAENYKKFESKLNELRTDDTDKTQKEIEKLINNTNSYLYIGLEGDEIDIAKEKYREIYLIESDIANKTKEIAKNRELILKLLEKEFGLKKGSPEYDKVTSLSANEVTGLNNLLTNNGEITDEAEIANRIASLATAGIENMGDELALLEDSWNVDSAIHFFDAIAKKADVTTKELDSLMSFIENSFTGEEFWAQVDKQLGTLKDIQTAYSSLTQVLQDYNETGYLTAAQIQELVNGDLIQYLSYANGEWKLNKDAIKKATTATINETKASINAMMAVDLLALSTGDFTKASSFMKEVAIQAGVTAESYGGKIKGLTVALAGVAFTAEFAALAQAKLRLSSAKTEKEIQKAEQAYAKAAGALTNPNVKAAMNTYISQLKGIWNSLDSTTDHLFDNINNASSAAKVLWDRYLEINHLLEIQNYLLEKNADAIKNAEDDVRKRLQLEYERIALLKQEQEYLKTKQTLLRQEGNSVAAALDKYSYVTASWNANKEQYVVDIDESNINKLSDKQKQEIMDYVEKLNDINNSLGDTASQISDINIELEELAFDYDKAISALDEVLSEQLEYHKALIEYQRDNDPLIQSLEDQIKLLEERKKVFEESVDEIEKMNAEIEKQRQLLRDLKGERNKAVYVEGQGWTWQADQAAIASAEEELNKMYQDLTIAKFDEQIQILTEQKEKQEAFYDEALALLEKQSANLDFLATQAAFNQTDNDLTRQQFTDMLKTYFPTLTDTQMQTILTAYDQGLNAIATAMSLVGRPYDTGGIANGMGLMKKQIKKREIMLGPDISQKVLNPTKSAQFTALVNNLDTLLSNNGSLAKLFDTNTMSGVSGNISTSSSQAVYNFEKLILPNVTDGKSFIDELNLLRNIAATSKNL